MTFPSDEQSPSEKKDAATLIVLALIRALHENQILPAQAVADVLDRRAINAAMRGRTGDEETVRMTTALVQKVADQIERATPFAPRDQARPPTEE